MLFTSKRDSLKDYLHIYRGKFKCIDIKWKIWSWHGVFLQFRTVKKTCKSHWSASLKGYEMVYIGVVIFDVLRFLALGLKKKKFVSAFMLIKVVSFGQN